MQNSYTPRLLPEVGTGPLLFKVSSEKSDYLKQHKKAIAIIQPRYSLCYGGSASETRSTTSAGIENNNQAAVRGGLEAPF
jgi:hypothetical protein